MSPPNTVQSVLISMMLSFALLSSPAIGDEAFPDLRAFLTEFVGMDRSELEDLAAGKAVVEVADAESNRELILCGVIRSDVPWDFAFGSFQNYLETRRKEGAIVIEQIGVPPSRDEFDAFNLPEDDIKSLKKAKRGDSDVKLTERMFGQLEKDVDWSGDPAPDVNRLFGDMLYRRTNAYIEGGIDNLAPYIDKKDPQTVRQGMNGVLSKSSVLYEHFPEFIDYLDGFPSSELAGAVDVYYCVLEDFGMKPTVSARHVTIFNPGDQYKTKFVVGEVGLYSSHYFQASFTVALFLEGEVFDEGETGYMVWVQRFWFDSDLKGIRRRTAANRLGDAARDIMERRRDNLQARYDASR